MEKFLRHGGRGWGDSFQVHIRTGMVLLSPHGQQNTVEVVDEQQRNVQRNQNLRWLGTFIRTNVFNSQQPVPVEEIEDGLLSMLEHDDFQMWPVIRDHSSLLPIYNRVDFGLRLHDELVNVVVNVDLNGYWRVLGLLQFPPGNQWHRLVQNSNIYLDLFYQSSGYNHRSRTREVQGYNLVRYHRNPSAHGLEQAVPSGPVEAATLPAAPLPPAGLPPRFVPRVAAQAGQVPVEAEFSRWQIGLMHYSVIPMFLHSFQRGMHLIGRLDRVKIQYHKKRLGIGRDRATVFSFHKNEFVGAALHGMPRPSGDHRYVTVYSICSAKGCTVLHHSGCTGSCNVTMFLCPTPSFEKRRIPVNIYCHAATNEQEKTLKLFTKVGAGVNGKCSVLPHLLFATEGGGYTDLVRLLLTVRADPNTLDDLDRLPIEARCSTVSAKKLKCCCQ